MHKYILWTTLSVLLLMGGIVLVLIDRTYFPVVQVSTPDGITLTFINRPLNLEEGCRSEVALIKQSIQPNCPQCVIQQADCLTVLKPIWHEAQQGQPSVNYAVHTEKQTILIDAPTPVAAATCTDMTAQISKQIPASCLPPKPAQ